MLVALPEFWARPAQGFLYGTATSGCEQPATMSRSSSVDGGILVQNPVFEDRRNVAGRGRHR